jgi:glycosyltransferase involved in cell wall biosynthesis
MPKILHVIADSNLGGGLTHVIQVLNLLTSSTSYELALLVNSSNHRSLICDQLYDHVKILEISFFGIRDFLRNFLVLRSQVASLECDLIHCHGGRSAFWISLLNLPVPIIYTVHGLHFVSRSGFSKYLGACIEWWNIKKSSYTIFVSNYDCQNAHGWNLTRNSRVTIIHNGINHANLLRSGSTSSMMIGVETSDSHKWDIAYIGRLEPVKDPILYLNIIKLLPAINAVLVGDGSLWNKVRQTVEHLQLDKRVYLAGAMPRNAVLQLISQSAVVVMTSQREGLPMVVLEAMALGIPVVASAVGGIPELIVDGETGFLISSRDPEPYANAVHRIISNPILYVQMGLASKARVQELFSEKTMLLKLSEIYQSCISELAN